jgi:hypothetical protein
MKPPLKNQQPQRTQKKQQEQKQQKKHRLNNQKPDSVILKAYDTGLGKK